MGESQPLPSIPEQGPPQEPPPLQTHVHTGLETLAVDRIKDEVVADPDMPEPAATTDHPADREETTAEIYIQELQPHKEEQEQAGTVHTDIALQSEQRAMQELHRFQKLSLLDPSQPGASPPAPPPTNLYPMLPREWPLARMSVLRVTLLRRLAELSFRGIGFTELPREVVREVHHDVDGICGAVAYHLTSLFAFLSPGHPQSMHIDHAELALYAELAFWQYGLLSFCAKTCESKTAEAGGIPALTAAQDDTPALEPSRNVLALMQTVIMSFGRNLHLGKPDLPVSDTHVYFPVQIVHRLVGQFRNLHYQEVTPQDGLGYRHNSGQDEANNPYIIVRAYEGHYAYNNRPAVPHTPRLAQAYRQGMLDANYGQSISFPSSYKCCFRLEVPVWYDADDGHFPPEVAQEATGIATLAKPVSPVAEKEPETIEAVHMGAEVAPANEDEEIEADEETYLVTAGYGCFSFQRGLLHRAARTYEVRSAGNKYEVIAAWLLEGLAVTISRRNWNILSLNRKCTMTDYYLLQAYFLNGFPSGERDDERRAYVVAHPKKLLPLTWEKAVERLSHPTYWVDTGKFGQARANTGFFTTINRANPVVADPDHVQAERDISETIEGATAAAHESCYQLQIVKLPSTVVAVEYAAF